MINNEAFELIEQRKEEGVTAEYLAKRLGITPRSAASWLSKWTRRGFLKYTPYEGGRVGRQEELERLERLGRLDNLEDRRCLEELRAWKLKNRQSPGRAGKPSGSQGKYVLGRKEWASYAHGKLEERMAFREDVKKW